VLDTGRQIDNENGFANNWIAIVDVKLVRNEFWFQMFDANGSRTWLWWYTLGKHPLYICRWIQANDPILLHKFGQLVRIASAR
jgi:hypothetical protein